MGARALISVQQLIDNMETGRDALVGGLTQNPKIVPGITGKLGE